MIIAAIQAVLLLLLLTQHVVAVNSPRLFMSSIVDISTQFVLYMW